MKSRENSRKVKINRFWAKLQIFNIIFEKFRKNSSAEKKLTAKIFSDFFQETGKPPPFLCIKTSDTKLRGAKFRGAKLHTKLRLETLALPMRNETSRNITQLHATSEPCQLNSHQIPLDPSRWSQRAPPDTIRSNRTLLDPSGSHRIPKQVHLRPQKRMWNQFPCGTPNPPLQYILIGIWWKSHTSHH